MRILLFGINYAPELTGIGKYTAEMASWMAANGHDVSVITAMPYYPEWKVHENYKKRKWYKEVIDGVKVYRTPLYVPKKVSSLSRILHEFSFLFSSIPHWLRFLFKRPYDIIFCISPPFHLGFAAVAYSKLFKSKLIIHVQDLQIDAAKDLGMIKNEQLLSLMVICERFLLKQCFYVSTISQGMKQKIISKGILESKVFLFPNWVDRSIVYPVTRSHSLRQEFGILSDETVVLYSGNLGEKQGLEIIIEVAKSLIQKQNLRFVIVGAGSGKKKLEDQILMHGLHNVKIYPLQPYEKLSSLLAIADIHLVLQKKSASDLVMPSKLTSILAVGGFAIVTAVPQSTLHSIIESHNMGMLVEPESADALRNAIDYAIATDTSVYKDNAIRYAAENLDKNFIMRSFATRVLEINPEFQNS